MYCKDSDVIVWETISIYQNGECAFNKMSAEQKRH